MQRSALQGGRGFVEASSRLRTRRFVGRLLSVFVVLISGVIVLVSCGSGEVDPGGLTGDDRSAAQVAMNAIQNSNIPRVLLALSYRAGHPPAACRVHLASRTPRTFRVYVFWVPFIEAQSYTWLNMTLGESASDDKFHMGAQAVNPVGVRPTGSDHGKTIESPNYDTPLSAYGSRQESMNKHVLMAHSGNAFAKPGANCEVLKNGYLRLLPNE